MTSRLTSVTCLDVGNGVRIESLQGRFPEGSFDVWRERIGGLAIEALQRTRFALVNLYNPQPIIMRQ